MIKTYNAFLLLAREKHGNKFSYIESTFCRYSVDKMTIIHNESGFKFEMIPAQHIQSKSGIPEEIAYNVVYPYSQFIKDIKEKLGNDFYIYEFVENSYKGIGVAMEIYKDKKKYYISPYNLFYYANFNNHLVSDEDILEYQKIINKYDKLKNFKNDNPKLYKKLSDAGFSYLWSHLNKSNKTVFYSEEYLRDLLNEYKRNEKSRSQFVLEHGSEHAFIRRNNLIHLYYECGLTSVNNLSQGVYACEFNLSDGKYAYVGLTFNFKERETDHRKSDIYSAVHKFIVKRNLDPNEMVFKIILEPGECEDVSKSETEVFEKYKREGWIMLNISPTGSRGHTTTTYYTKEEVKKIIDDNNLKTVHELYILNRKAYYIARKEGYLDDLLERKTHKKLKKK